MAEHDQDLRELGIRPQCLVEDDWEPTPHGRFFAGVLAEHPEIYRDREVLELGAGTAIHTILLERGGAGRVVATEYQAELLESTEKNLEAHDCGEVVDLVVADWLDVEGRFDLIVTNPPFCKSGKRNRRYFIDELILNAHKRLRPRGSLLFIQSSMADLEKTLRRLDENGFDAEVIDSCRGPFRDYYYEDDDFIAEIQEVPDAYQVIEGQEYERLDAIHARLRR